MLSIKSFANDAPELYGISLRIASTVCFAIMVGLIKYLGGAIPLGQVVFFRSAVALIPLMIFLLMTSDFPAGLKTKYPWKHITRCVLGTLAMFFSFATLRYLPIAEATAISYLSPVFIVILAIVLLKEQVSIRRWLGVACGVIGLIIMTVPSFSLPSGNNTLIGLMLGLISALLIAAAMLQVRQLSKMGENSAAIAFYFALTSTVMGFIVMLSNWQLPTLTQWVCLIGIGLIGGIAQILMTVAFKYAEASAMAPYEYLSIIWAVIIGMVAFGEVPNWVFWIAMPLILFGGFIAKPKKPLKNAHFGK